MESISQHITIEPGCVGQSLFEDRKSQFFGFARHVESAQEAIDFRHGIMERIPEASHYVSAWILADGTEFFSDAKEPHGTAGMPVLSAIRGRELADAVCVVARVFGGTLLGKGGLMRAYTKAAVDAIDEAPLARCTPCQLMEVTIPYPLYEPARKRLTGWNARLEDELFTENVTLCVSVALDGAEQFVAHVNDFSNGRARYSLGAIEARYLPL